MFKDVTTQVSRFKKSTQFFLTCGVTGFTLWDFAIRDTQINHTIFSGLWSIRNLFKLKHLKKGCFFYWPVKYRNLTLRSSRQSTKTLCSRMHPLLYGPISPLPPPLPHIASSCEERPGQVHYCIMHDEEEGEEEENFALCKERLAQVDELLVCKANFIPEPR